MSESPKWLQVGILITILTIVAAVLLPTIGSVNGPPLDRIVVELSQLEQAIEAYKLDVGDYPPDFSNRLAVIEHVRRAYPLNERSIDEPGGWLTMSYPDGRRPEDLDPAESIVFWLSSVRNNPQDPLGDSHADAKVYFDFNAEQMTDVDSDGWPEYAPRDVGTPYVYFDGRMLETDVCAYLGAVYPSPGQLAGVGAELEVPLAPDIGFGVVRPYKSNAGAWIDARKFQIIAAGDDGAFGADHYDAEDRTPVFKTFPEPNYYQASVGNFAEVSDNLATFTEGRTMGECAP